MRPVARILTILLAVFLSRADDWPVYLGDLAHTSFRANETQITAANARQLQQLWRTSLGSPVASAVTVDNGSLFFGDWSGNFHSMSAATGSVAWSQFLGVAPNPSDPACSPGVGVTAQPVVSGQTVYAGGGDSAVYAMDRGTGQIQWRVPLADPQAGSYLWSSLSIYQNALYIGIASLTDCPLVRGGIARIPLNDPSHPVIQYFVPASTTGAGIWSTPAFDADNNMIYVTTGNAAQSVQDASAGIWGSALLALDAATLQIQSSFFLPSSPQDNDADWGSSPLLFQSGGQSYVAANGKTGVMYVLTRPDLTPVWNYKLARDCDSPEVGCGSISTPAFDGRLLITGSGQPDSDTSPAGMVYAFDPVTQSLVWSYGARAAVLGAVTITPGVVYVSTTQGVAVLDESTGSEVWNDGSTTGSYSQPVVSNGALYTTYINGDVVAWTVPGSSASPALTTSQTAFKFLYTSGGALPPAQNLAVSTATPGVNFTVASDSPWLTTDSRSGTTSATLAVTASPLGMAPGVYTGTLTLSSALSSPVVVTVTMVVNPAPPTVTAGQIVNAGGYGSSLAPGSLFTIFATGLSGDTKTVVGSPWPAMWNGISVLINGVPAPLSYVGPSQINAQIPFELAPGPAALSIQSNGVASMPVNIAISATAPGLFTDPAGRAAVLNQDYSTNSAANPAAAGSYIAVYWTGQGAVTNAVATGAAAPQRPLSSTGAATTATVGGLPASVVFSGLAPGLVGVAQANLLLPDLPAGDYSLLLTVGGTVSNAGIVSVTHL